MQYDASIEREQTFWRGEQWIDVDLGDPGLFDHQLTEADQQIFQCRQCLRAYVRERPSGRENLGLLHHALGQR